MAREKCGLLAVPRTVTGSRDVSRSLAHSSRNTLCIGGALKLFSFICGIQVRKSIWF